MDCYSEDFGVILFTFSKLSWVFVLFFGSKKVMTELVSVVPYLPSWCKCGYM